MHITVWKIYHNFIRTFTNLHNRRMGNSTLYPGCKTEPEILEHVFCDCTTVHVVWNLLGLTYRESAIQNNFAQWMEELLTNTTKEQQQVLFYGIWAIWKDRNRHCTKESTKQH